MEYETDRQIILGACSDRFNALHAHIGRLVMQHFPKAKPVQVWSLAAWQVEVPNPPPQEAWKGTLPNDVFTVGPTEKKAGITIHVWHPNRPSLLADNAVWLKKAGFKPMVGCLQWNRKSELPLDAFDRLMAAAKEAM